MKRFKEYDLRASYFVEALSVGVIGAATMREVIDTIQEQGHPVELHAHTEWLPWIPDSPCPAADCQHFDQLSLEQQTRVIERGMQYLSECGVREVHAFRAGNCTPNLDTLAALARVGIEFDSSFNISYTRNGLDRGRMMHPTQIGRICEVPVSWFIDGLRRYRPAHIAACSVAELSHALLQAWHEAWPAFVILLHGFDMLTQARTGPDKRMVVRFETLCRFLADNRDKFRTVTFADVTPADLLDSGAPHRPLRSSLRRTASRYTEQLLRRHSELGSTRP
jgi:hypothetical protein